MFEKEEEVDWKTWSECVKRLIKSQIHRLKYLAKIYNEFPLKKGTYSPEAENRMRKLWKERVEMEIIYTMDSLIGNMTLLYTSEKMRDSFRFYLREGELPRREFRVRKGTSRRKISKGGYV